MTDRDPLQRIQRDMAEALLMSPVLSTDGGRQLFLDRVSSWLGGQLQVRQQPTPRAQIIEIVHRCLKQSGGLNAMVEVAAEFDPIAPETLRLWQLRDEWEAAANPAQLDVPGLPDALMKVVVPNLHEAVRIATGSRAAILPAHCRTPWHVYLHLRGANAAPGSLPPWMAFLDYIAPWLDPELAREIRARNQQLAAEWELVPQLEAARWPPAETLPDAATAATMAYLMIQLDPDPVDSDRFTLSYWYQSDPYDWRPVRGEDRLVHRTDLETAVEELVGDMEAAWGDRPGAATVEFLLPWELLNAPVEWWPKDSTPDPPIPLTRDYPVIVRSLDRLRDRPWHRVWRQRWAQLEASPAVSHAHWSRPRGDDHIARLGEELRADNRIVSLVLSEPPQSGSRTSRQEIKTALRFGVPVIIWHRQDCSTPAFRQSVADLLVDGGLAQLPGRAHELRLAALQLDPDAREGHIGRHLTVLWDDPRHQPQAPEPFGAGEGRS